MCSNHRASCGRHLGGGVWLVLLAGAGLWTIHGCGVPLARGERDRLIEITSTDVTQVRSTTELGELRFQGVDDPAADLRITAVIHAQGPSAAAVEETLQAVEVETPVEGGTLTLAWTWRHDPPSGCRAWVDYDVTLPATIALALSSHNGAIHVERHAAPATLATHNGRIEVRGGQGTLSATTRNGALLVETAAQNIELATYNGQVVVALERAGDVNGSIESHNGSIEVTFGEQAAAAIECRTRHGSIDSRLDLENETRRDNMLQGLLRGGAGLLAIETHNGGIELR